MREVCCLCSFITGLKLGHDSEFVQTQKCSWQRKRNNIFNFKIVTRHIRYQTYHTIPYSNKCKKDAMKTGQSSWLQYPRKIISFRRKVSLRRKIILKKTPANLHSYKKKKKNCFNAFLGKLNHILEKSCNMRAILMRIQLQTYTDFYIWPEKLQVWVLSYE